MYFTNIKYNVFFALNYFSYCNSTGGTNLAQHLLNVHEITLFSTREKEKQLKLSNAIFPKKGSANQKPNDPKSSFIFFRQITLWFCRDLVPLSTVEKSGFNDFWKFMNNACELPSRATVSISALDDLYLCCKNKLIERLQNSGLHATITFDGWSDSHKRISYVTYTYHFLENWKMKSAVLKTASFAHPHTSKRIKDDYEATMAEFNVLSKRLSVVTDGASSMVKAANLLDVYRFYCVGHIIHLLFRSDLLKHENMQPLRDLKVKLRKIHRKLMYKHEELRAMNDESIQQKMLILMEEFKEMGTL